MTRVWPALLAAGALAACDGGLPVERIHHSVCFGITGRPHGGVACLDCHTEIPSVALTGDAVTCASGTADCVRCHTCSAHPAVAGFACVSRRCYECHGPPSPAPLTAREVAP